MAEAGAGQNPDPNPDPKPAPHCAWVPRDDEEFEVSDEEECLLAFIQLRSPKFGKVHVAFLCCEKTCVTEFVTL